MPIRFQGSTGLCGNFDGLTIHQHDFRIEKAGVLGFRRQGSWD